MAVNFGSLVMTDPTSANYALSLGRRALLERGFNNLDKAIGRGNLQSAQSALRNLSVNNPEYSKLAPVNTNNPVSVSIRQLATAIEDGNLRETRKIWTQLQDQLAQNGLAIKDSSTTSARAQAVLQRSSGQTLLQATFGGNYSAGGLAGGVIGLFGGASLYNSYGQVTSLYGYTPGDNFSAVA